MSTRCCDVDACSGERHDPEALVLYENGEVYRGGFETNKRVGAALWTDAKGNIFRGRYLNDEKDLSDWTCHQIYLSGRNSVLFPNGLYVCVKT